MPKTGWTPTSLNWMLIKQNWLFLYQKAEGSIRAIFIFTCGYSLQPPLLSWVSLKIWVCGLILNSLSPNLCRKFVKVVFLSSEILDGLGNILTLALLSWLPIVLSAAGWTAVIPFTGASQSSNSINHSVYRTVLLELSLTLVNSAVSLLF